MSDGPNELTFYTDVRVDTIVEIADLPVKNEEWKPGEKWATVEGCLIFREGDSKIRTTLTREEVWEMIEKVWQDCATFAATPWNKNNKPARHWITVPHTIREATATANLNLV